MLRAEDARAHAARIVDADRRNGGEIDAERGDGAQRIRRAVVHEHRRAPRADRLGDFAEDRLRRFVERDGAAEDLADRVEEIDLLVPLGELVRGVLHLERGLQVLRDDRAAESP